MTLQKIIDRFELKTLTNLEDREITGVYISDMLSDVMSSAQAGNLWLTIQAHKNIVSAANLIDISAIIVTNNKKVQEETIELANRFHVVILSSSLSTFEMATELIEAGIK